MSLIDIFKGKGYLICLKYDDYRKNHGIEQKQRIGIQEWG